MSSTRWLALHLAIILLYTRLEHIAAAADPRSQQCYRPGIYIEKYRYKSTETVTINCTVTGPSPAQPQLLYIQGASRNPSIVQNVTIDQRHDSTIIGSIDASKLGSTTTFFCKYGTCRPSFRSFKTVRVSKVQAIRQPTSPPVECVFYDLKQLICTFICQSSWTECPWRLQYTTGTDPNYHCCDPETRTTTNRDNCPLMIEGTCTVPGVHAFTQYQMVVSQGFGTTNITRSFNITTDSSVLQLRPVEDVQIKPGHRQLDVAMTLGTSPRSVGNITCVVTLTSEWEPSLQKNVSFNYTNSTMRVENAVLWNLEAFTVYNISITCKPTCSKYWSRPFITSARTVAERPTELPTVVTYSEQKPEGSDMRTVTIYWKTVKQRLQYGNVTEYAVTVVPENITEWFPADVTAIILTEPVISWQPCSLVIGGRNEAGTLRYSQPYRIRSYEPDIHTMTVVAEEVKSLLWTVVLFEHEDTDLDYTSVRVFWCQVQFVHTNPPICQSDVDFTTSNSTNGELLDLSLTEPRSGHVWTFGVSLNQSATIWSSCTFYYKQKDVNDDKTSKVIAIRSSRNHSAVEVYLNFNYCQLPYRPIMYQVCVVQNSENITCEESDIQNITASPTMSKFTIETDINIHTEVSLCFRTVFRSNVTENFKHVLVKQDAQLTGSRHDPTPVAIGLGITVALVALVAVTIGCKKLKGKLTKQYDIEDVPIQQISDYTDNVDKHVCNGYVIIDQSDKVFGIQHEDISDDDQSNSHEDEHGLAKSTDTVTSDGYLIPTDPRTVLGEDVESNDIQMNNDGFKDDDFIQNVQAQSSDEHGLSDCSEMPIESDKNCTPPYIPAGNCYPGNPGHFTGIDSNFDNNPDNDGRNTVLPSSNLNYLRFSDGIAKAQAVHVTTNDNSYTTKSQSPIPFYVQYGKANEPSDRPMILNCTELPYVETSFASVALPKPAPGSSGLPFVHVAAMWSPSTSSQPSTASVPIMTPDKSGSDDLLQHDDLSNSGIIANIDIPCTLETEDYRLDSTLDEQLERDWEAQSRPNMNARAVNPGYITIDSIPNTMPDILNNRPTNPFIVPEHEVSSALSDSGIHDNNYPDVAQFSRTSGMQDYTEASIMDNNNFELINSGQSNVSGLSGLPDYVLTSVME